jgi:hypothetical protein
MMKSLFFIVVLGLLPGNASASMDWLTQYQQSNLHIGQLALHPFYDLSEVYDSNIYLVPRDQPNGVTLGGGHRESWITKNDLGLETDLPWHRLHDLSMGYGFESETYTTQPNTNNAYDQSVHADYTYKGAYGLTYKAGEKYVNTTDQAFSELTGRDHRWENAVSSSLDYDPVNGRLAGGIDISQVNDKYLDPVLAQQLNRYEDLAGFNVGYKVRPKTKVYASYHRDLIHYSVPQGAGIEKDSRSNNAALGVIGELSSKLEGQVEVGATDRQYDVAAAPGQTRVFITPTIATAVTYKADPYTIVKLSISRFAEESIDTSNPLYYENIALLEVKHAFPHKFSAGLQGSWEIDQYPFNQVIDSSGAIGRRRDDTYQVGAWVTYVIQKWLSTGLSFSHRERDSTMSGQFDFEDNQATWHVTLKF